MNRHLTTVLGAASRRAVGGAPPSPADRNQLQGHHRHGGYGTYADGQSVTRRRHGHQHRQTKFVDKGLQVVVTVDGSEGARLRAGTGVLWPLVESDDPGPVFVDGRLVNEGVYHEPTDPPVKDPSFDVTAVHEDDAVEYKQISEVTNTVGDTVNNGVVVDVGAGSTWTVTGTSYLSRLTRCADSTVRAGQGQTLTTTVDGLPTPIVAGASHAGAIKITTG